MGGTIGVAPGLLNPRTGEQLRHRLRSEVAQAGGGRAGERLRLLRQSVPELPGNVDVGEDLVHEIGAERVLDRLVGQKLGARVGPVVRVERLALCPGGDDRDDPHDHRQREHDGNPAASMARHVSH